MLRFSIGIAAFCFAAAAPAASDPTPPPADAKPASQPAKRARLICIETATTGSRLSATKVCKTKAEWDRDSEDTFDRVQKALDRPNR